MDDKNKTTSNNVNDDKTKYIDIVVDKNTSKPTPTTILEKKDEITKPELLNRSNKKSILSTIFLIAICAVGIIIMFQLGNTLSQGNKLSLSEIISNMNVKYFIIALVVLVCMVLLDAFKFMLIAKVTVGRANFPTGMKVALLGKYYDNITPFSTGGQPFQIYYLNKKGYTGGQSSAITLIKYFAQMFAWLTVGGVLMATQGNVLSTLDSTVATTIKVGAWVGFGFNAIIPVTIIMFVIMPKVATFITSGVVTLLKKLHIVKDKEKTMARAYKIVSDFKECFSIMSKRPLIFVFLVLICFFEPIVTLAFPYFIVVSFANVVPSVTLMITVMALNIFASYSVAIIPTPGNSGFVETSFTLAFSTIASTVLFWVTFTWRFFTYYIYILIGIGISIFELIRNTVRAKRLAKNNENISNRKEQK